MASSYPGGYDVLADPGANLGSTPLHSVQHIAVNDAVEATQATLGLNPQGAYATVQARLERLGAIVSAEKLPASLQNAPGAASWAGWTQFDSTVTVPSWATKAMITGSVTGIYDVGTNNIYDLRLAIGTDASPKMVVNEPSKGANNRMSLPLVGQVTLTSTGSKTLQLQTWKISGSSTWAADTIARLAAVITFMP